MRMTRLAAFALAIPILLSGCANNMETQSSSVPASGRGAATPVEIIAHRGASDLAPENTKVAYVEAWQRGADAVETDVYLTSDNQVVCIHDASTKRTTGVDMDVKSSTYADLRKLDAGSWKDSKYAGEPLPLLTECLATMPLGKTFYVEVKCGPEVLPYLDRIFNESGKRQQIAIISFDLTVCGLAKKQMPDRPVYWLRGTREDKDTKVTMMHDLGWIDLVKFHKLDGLDVHYGGMTRQWVDAVREAGLGLVVWTVDEKPDAVRMRDLGIDGLTTNHIEILKGAS